MSSGIIVVVLFAAVVFAFGAVLAKVVIAERAAAKREIKSVSRVFETHQMAILEQMERYAASNAAYQNVITSYSQDWVEKRFGEEMALDFAQRHVALISPGDEVVFSRDLRGVESADFFQKKLARKLEDALNTIRINYRASLETNTSGVLEYTGAYGAVAKTSIVMIANKPNIVSAFAIVPDPGGIRMKNENPAILVSVVEMNEPFFDTLLASLSLDNLGLEAEISDGKIGVPLEGKHGEHLGFLTWHPMSQASSIILASIPVLALALGAIFLIAVLALRQNTRAQRNLALREQEMRHAALHDSMTGFATRGHLYAQADEFLAGYRDKVGAILIYLDLDNLKDVNDIHGHMAGDSLIITLAKRIRNHLGENGLAGRLGGDEFVILIPNPSKVADLDRLLNDLFEDLERPVEFEGTKIDTACSAGVAIFPSHSTDILNLIRCADIALHRCKAEKKGSYRLFQEKMDLERQESRRIRRELKNGIREKQFVLFYQSIVDAKSGEPIHREALLRWRHPVRGLVPPGVFIPIAQEAGLLPDIGAWVLEQAIQDARYWEDIGVSVNVSTDQLKDEGFAEYVSELLIENELSPKQLTLEITEDLMLEDSDDTMRVFKELIDLKIGLAIDDFGTGYSSLSYLNKYRFNALKIDRSFVSRIGFSEEDNMLIHSLIGLAKVMGMRTVGEGVETSEQRKFLLDAGCDYLQGYFFDKPAPLSETTLKKAG